MFKLIIRTNASLPYGLVGGIIGCLMGYTTAIIGTGAGHWIGVIVLAGYSGGVGLVKVWWFMKKIKEPIELALRIVQAHNRSALAIVQIVGAGLMIIIAFNALTKLLSAVQGESSRRTALTSTLFNPWLLSPALFLCIVVAITTIGYGEWDGNFLGWPGILMPPGFDQVFNKLIVYPLIGTYGLIGITLGLCAGISCKRVDATSVAVAGAFDATIVGLHLGVSWLNMAIIANLGAIAGILLWRGAVVLSDARRRSAHQALQPQTATPITSYAGQMLLRMRQRLNRRQSHPSPISPSVANCPMCGGIVRTGSQFCSTCGTGIGIRIP